MGKLWEKWNGTALMRRLRNQKLTGKLTVIYLLIVLAPSLLTVYLMDVNYYRILWERYYENAEKAYGQEVENLELRLQSVEGLTAYFTANSVFMDYADTSDISLSESVYSFMKYLQDAFDAAKQASPYVTRVTVYTRAHHDFKMTGTLENLEEDSVPPEVTESLTGLWFPGQEEGVLTLNYYKPVYTANYSKFVGVIRIRVDADRILDCLTEERIYFHSEDGSLIFAREDGGNRFLTSMEEIDALGGRRLTYASTRESRRLKGTFVTETVMQKDFLNSFLIVLLPSVLILLFLPFIYQRMLNRTFRRITALTDYIGRIRTANPEPYREPFEYGDEIGTLIRVYNENTQKISRLSREIDLAELARKDSEFYALQAQIKPHFLYNTLENIRMTAVQEGDEKVASMLEILGSYMRYGLKKDQKYTYLVNELQHIRAYQQLMDIRFPGKIRLEFSVYADITEVMCPYLILQPLIENAIKHGLGSEGRIRVLAEIRDEREGINNSDIEIRICDDGKGLDEGRLQEIRRQLESGASDRDGHVGLNNINFRMISCYGRNYAMRIESRVGEGCCILLRLPRRTDPQETWK